MFALAKREYPWDAGIAACVELVTQQDIPIIYQHYLDFNTGEREKKKKTSEDRSEPTSSMIDFMSLKTLCSQRSAAVVSDPV